MANNYMGNMTFGVNFKVDTKALDQLDTQFSNILDGITRFSNTAKGNNVIKQQAEEARKAYSQLYDAMSKAYNSKLGQFDLSKVNAGLKEAGTSLSTVVTQLNGAGQNVNSILSSFMGNKLMIKETNQFLDKMAVTFGNTIRWSLTTKIINTITGSIQKAFYFTKDLDRSLNDIRVVTGKSADEMERFARQATNAAQALGKTTTDYTKASLLYYQQGLGDKEVAARTETTLKAANVTGQSTSQVSEQLTAVWNGYKVSAEETELYVDKLAKVAASTASNLEELSTGMSKVASAANMMGVDIDQLNAQLSTVISVTRQAPETIGAAFKTVYARMSTISAGGIDEEDGATLKSYTEKMNQFGISVLDSNGKLRNMGEVIEEIGDKWNNFSREAQVGLAQAMGGTRQYSNLTALFENWDKYQAALRTSQEAEGTLQKQQDIYMDSIAAHFEQLTAEAEKFYQTMFDEDTIKDITDGFKFLIQEINQFVKSIGGGTNALISFGATVVNLFSNQIGKSIGQLRNNMIIGKEQKASVSAVTDLVDQVRAGNGGISSGTQVVNGPVTMKDVATSFREDQVVMSNETLKQQADIQKEILSVSQQLGTEEYNQLTAENEKVAFLRAQVDTYNAILAAIEADVDVKKEEMTADEIADRLAKSDLDAEEREIAILKEQLTLIDDKLAKAHKLTEEQKKYAEQLGKESQQSFTYRINVANMAKDYAQERVNAKQQASTNIVNLKQSSADLTAGKNNSDVIKFGKNNEYKQQLQSVQQLLQLKAKNNTLTTQEQMALRGINNYLADNKATVSQINKLTQNLTPLEKDVNEQLEKEKENLAQAEEHAKNLANEQKATEKAAQETAKKLLKGKNENQLANERSIVAEELEQKTSEYKKDTVAEKYRNVQNPLTEGAKGNAAKWENEANTRDAENRRNIENAKRQEQWSKGIRAVSGAARAATALVGGLNTALDSSADAATRASGYWEAGVGTLTGTLSAINPALGMAASAVTGLAKTIFDATGITDWFADKLKTDAERLDDTRNAMVKATEAVKELNQRMSEQQSLTATYQSQLKSLDEIKESWDTIVNKINAGIALTQTEQEEYEKIKNQLIELNDGLILGYDEQHNAIIDVNSALKDTIDLLTQQYNIEHDIKEVTVDEQIAAYNELLDKQEKYQKQAAEFKDSELAQSASKGFNLAKSGVERGQVIDLIYDDTWSIDDEQTIRDAGYGAQFDTVKEFFTKYGDLSTAIDKANKEEVEAFRDAVSVIEKNADGHRFLSNIADIDDVLKKTFEVLDQAVIINEGKEDQDATKEMQNLIKNMTKEFKQNTLDVSGAGNDIISSIAEKVSTDLYAKRLNSGERLTAENKDKWEKEAQAAAQAEIDRLNKHSTEIENLVQKASQLELRRSKMTMKEYYDAKSQLYAELSDEVRTDTELMNKVFGEGNYGAGLRNKLQGNTYRTMDASGRNVTHVETDLDRFLNKTGVSENDINVNPDDYNKFVKFMQEYTQRPTGDLMTQAKDNALGSSNWEDLWEGFQKAENPNFKMFHEKLPEITSELDEIKNMSLDGSALDEEKYEALLDSLDQYDYKLKDVGAEVDILHDKELYGSQLWYESLERVEKELRATQDKALLGERSQLVENLELDTADAEQQLKDLTSKDYEIIVHLDTEGEDTYQTAIKEIENMQKSLSYVGEEGKIAAENVYEFLNAFPEMNDMIKELNSDGSISLTKEQIQLVRERSEANITAILAEREIELKADLDRMQAEKDRIENQKILIKEELSNWGQKEFNKEQFVKNFTEFYGDSADTQLKITETDNDYMNDDTYDTSVAIATYWDQASTKAAESYRAFAESVIQNNSAIENNNKADLMHAVTAGSGIDKIDYESQKTQTEELLNDIQNLGNESIDQQKALLEQMLASLDKEGDLIDSSIEKQQNRMIALNAQGLAAIKNAGDLGKKTKEAAWEAKHLYDYYHDVNKELDFINQKLTVLQKKQKLLEGSALLKNLKLQSKEYENQIKYLQQKRGIQEGYQQELQTRQKDELGNKGLAAYGITFDKNGYIENYAEIAKKLQEGQHDKESVEDYQNFINQVKTYEENLKLALDLEGQLYDVVAKRQELQSKAVEERVKMILDVSEARKKYMEFTKELGNWKVNLIINPDQTAVDAATAKAAESFVEDSITAMEKSARMVKKGNSAVDRLKAGDFDVDKKGNKTDYVKFNGQKYKMEDLLKLEEDVDKFADAASQSAADIQQAYQNTLDAYSNAMKELNDWDKRVLAKYDMINGVYDHAEKLTELWYGNDSLEAKIMLTANQQEKTDNLYAKAKEANEQVKEDWDIYQDAVLQGNEKLAEEAYDAWAESIQNLQSLTEQFAEQRKKQLTDELDLAAKIVETQLYGGKSRDEFKNSWELINKQAETYLDTINAQFGVTQLENKYLQAINKSIGNTKSQEKLNKIMNEEMKMLKEKDKLTKYDLERAEAKYDLTLKQMALEEARDNKTNLRLRRDSQGNYTYQYVADENDILKAQNDVDIAKNNLYNMDRDRAQEMTEKQLSAEEEYAQKYADLQEQFIDDEEGRLAAEAELYDAYYGENGILTGIMNERGVAFENLNESIDESLNGTGEKTVLGSFEKLRQNLPEEISKLAPALDPSIKTVMDKWTNKETGVASAYKILTDDTKQFFEDYKADIEQFAKDIDQDSTFGKVRTTFDTVKTKVDEFKASAAEADTAIGQLNSTGSKFSLNTLITDFETLASDLGGANNENGLIYRINQANSELMELVNPEEKKNNFKEIRESLAKIRTTLEKNKDKFDWSLNEIDKWKKAVVGHAQDAETEIGLVKKALDALADKKVTVTVETVYTTKGSPSKESSGNSSGGGDTQNLDNLKGNDKKEPVATVYNVKNLNSNLGGNYTFEDKSAAEAYVKQYPDAGPVTTQQVYKGDGVYLYKNIVTHSGMNSLPIVAKIPDFDQYKKYDTGGYTGAWGDQGKLAMLHEKELVLNKEDTENILDAVDLIRQIDMKQMQMNMMNNYLNALEKVQDKYALDSQSSTTIQNITINADFPDASDRDEIKAAFDSLVNLASQRASRKRH